MNTQKFFAALLIIIGALSLAYGGFNYTEQTHQADIGSLHVAVDQVRHVSTPVWMGSGIMILGFFLLVTGKKA